MPNAPKLKIKIGCMHTITFIKGMGESPSIPFYLSEVMKMTVEEMIEFCDEGIKAQKANIKFCEDVWDEYPFEGTRQEAIEFHKGMVEAFEEMKEKLTGVKRVVFREEDFL